MDSLFIYDQKYLLSLTKERAGERKIGQNVCTINDLDSLAQSRANFVLLGIPEDIGIRANFGIAGSKHTWNEALIAFLNLQSNSFFSGEDIIVLGHLNIADSTAQDLATLRERVSEIDNLVYPLIEKIVAAGKIPIIIGGGHNNAYGIIKGTAIALNEKINVVNVDAHADLRALEGRHSGNPFSYALADGHLHEYRIFGLQQAYINESMRFRIEEEKNLKAFYFDDMLSTGQPPVELWKNWINDLPSPCGLELDMDSVAHQLSSAVSPTGFSLNELRSFVLNAKKNFTYLHICEAACLLSDGRKDAMTAKSVAILIADFIKALRLHNGPQL